MILRDSAQDREGGWRERFPAGVVFGFPEWGGAKRSCGKTPQARDTETAAESTYLCGLGGTHGDSSSAVVTCPYLISIRYEVRC